MKTKINSLLSYFSNLGKEGTKESSKRALAIYTTVVLGSYVVVVFTNEKNMEFVLGEILTFSLTLLGVTAWEKTKLNKDSKISKTEEDENR